MSGSPEEILRGALEKIVFFECRVDQLESELRASRATAARAREEAGVARRRESELESRLAAARADGDAARAEVAELSERVKLLQEERSRFLSGMVEQARLAGASASPGAPAGEQAELAGFIAELRGEIDRLSRWKAAAQAAGLAVEDGASATLAQAAGRAPESLPRMVERFAESGRARLAEGEAASLAPRFATRSERALYLSSLEELSSPDPGSRRRAAACLRALGSGAAAPVLAAQLGREADGQVKAAIVSALGALGERAVADLVVRELGDERPVVRAAALEAVAALHGRDALPALATAMGDESPAVRRRAAVLLGFLPGDGAEESLSSALHDRDPGVARAAAVALAGRPSARAQGALARALDHREPAVRRAAARAVERWSGESVDAAAGPAEMRRTSRRIAERLYAMDRSDLRGAVAKVAEGGGPERGEGARAAPAAPAVHVTVAVAEEPAPALADAVLAEVRAALRGRTAAELSVALGADPAAVEGALRALAARGQLTPRGPRFFLG